MPIVVNTDTDLIWFDFSSVQASWMLGRGNSLFHMLFWWLWLIRDAGHVAARRYSDLALSSDYVLTNVPLAAGWPSVERPTEPHRLQHSLMSYWRERCTYLQFPLCCTPVPPRYHDNTLAPATESGTKDLKHHWRSHWDGEIHQRGWKVCVRASVLYRDTNFVFRPNVFHRCCSASFDLHIDSVFYIFAPVTKRVFFLAAALIVKSDGSAQGIGRDDRAFDCWQVD